MQRCYHRHAEVFEKMQDMAAGLAPKDSVLMLQRNDADAAGIDKLGCRPIGDEIGLRQLEPHPRRVAVMGLRIVHGYDKKIGARVLSNNRVAQISRERGNSTLSRNVVAD